MARWIVGIMVVLVVLGGLGLPAAQAQDDLAEQVRPVVERWLLQEIGRPGMKLIEYSYSGGSWADTSLGCPVEGETYTPETVNGYVWSFFYENFVRYEVHSSLDAKLIVLCSAQNVAPDVRLMTYQTPHFSILIPEAWIITPNADQSEVVFGPQQQPSCDQPGMRVAVIGRVAAGVTPEQLISDALVQAGSPTSGVIETVGTFGRSTTYTVPCDTLTQQRRISAFVQYGSAYQVEQWVPQEQANQWDTLFLNMLSQFAPPGAGSTAQTTTTPAPTGTGTPGTPVGVVDMAQLPALPMAHLFMGDVFIGALNDIPGRSITVVPAAERRHLAFSPDGLRLSFIDATDGELRIVDVVGGKSSRKVAEGVDPTFPPSWNLNSQEVAYVVAGEAGAPYEIRAVPAAGGEPRTLGSFAVGGTCETSSSDPADPLYFQERGANGHQAVLVWMPDDQFLISTRCDGGIGLLKLADGSVTDLGADLVDGAPAPDRLRFAARTADGLAVLDFQSWQRTNLGVGEGVGQIAWGADGQMVYFSVEMLAESIPVEGVNEDLAQTAFGSWPITINVYNLELARVNLDNKQETVLWQGQGRGIGRIAPAADGSGVLFSLIGSSLPQWEVFQAGGDEIALRAAQPAAALYWLANSTSTAILMAYSGQPVFAPVTVGAPAAETVGSTVP